MALGKVYEPDYVRAGQRHVKVGAIITNKGPRKAYVKAAFAGEYNFHAKKIYCTSYKTLVIQGPLCDWRAQLRPHRKLFIEVSGRIHARRHLKRHHALVAFCVGVPTDARDPDRKNNCKVISIPIRRH